MVVAWRPVPAVAILLLASLPILLVQSQPNTFFSMRNEVTSDLIELEP